MSFKTNLNASAENPLQIKFGSYNLRQEINSPPTLTVVNYVKSLQNSPNLDNTLIYSGLSFYLTNISYKENFSLKQLENENIRYELTLTYTHKSQKLLLKAINTADFLRSYSYQGLKIGLDFYRFEINSLISAFIAYSGIKGITINGLTGYVNLPAVPSNRETFGLPSFLSDRALINKKIAVYSETGINYVPLGAGRPISDDPIGEVNILKGEVLPYKNTLLNWSGDQNYGLQNRYVEISNDEYLVFEGSPNPHIPPQEASLPNKAPRDLSVMADNSGFSKEFKLTKYKFNKPDIEISGVYGFAHAALELVTDPLMPHSTITQNFVDRLIKNPLGEDNAFQKIFQDLTNESMGYAGADVFNKPMKWRITSIKQTVYEYVTLDLDIQPKVIDFDGNYINIEVPPQYEQLLKSNMQVLTKEYSFGWELKRFANEDPKEWARGSIDAYLRLKTAVELGNVVLDQNSAAAIKYWHLSLYRAKVGLENYLYRKIPIWEEVNYAIRPYSRYYKEGDKVDWKIENIPKAQVPSYSGKLDPVPVLFPDPNWVPNLMVVARSRYKVSIGVAGNPDFNPFAIRFFNTNPMVVTTGTEEFELTKYNILPSKSTKPAISELQSEFCDINGLLDSINANQQYPGTYYKPFEYMQVGDYGIIGQTPIVPINAGDILPTGTKEDPSEDNTSAFRIKNDSSVKDDQFQTTRSFRTSTDAGFKSNVLNSTFSIEQGRPPEATIRKPLFELDPNQLDNGLKDTLTYITSNTKTRSGRVRDDVSISNAQNLVEAVGGAEFLLESEMFNQGTTINTTFPWGSKLKPNSKLEYNGTSFGVKNTNQIMQFYGGTAYEQPLQVELGELASVTIQSRVTQVTSDSTIQRGLIITINPNNLPNDLGTVLANIPEDFGRYVDGSGSGLSIE